VHHIKIYIFDDDVLITGANLSESYFTDRQDRWFYLSNVKELADYLEDSINCIVNNAIEIDYDD
jgi:CDP-diacylglycerol--glycerol-3-phosphate 3-phosphatidyltransferase